MDWTGISLNTPVSELPKLWNNNFTGVQNYLDVFYDASRGTAGILIKPLETTGRVKAATGEFVNVVVDNLTIKTQWTNLYENYTTIDLDWVYVYNGEDVSTRASSADSSTNPIWPMEPSAYTWVDITTAQVKIIPDVSYGFAATEIGREVRIIYDPSIVGSEVYWVLLDSSIGGELNLKLSATATEIAQRWATIIVTAYDVSYGPTWTLKQSDGTETVS